MVENQQSPVIIDNIPYTFRGHVERKRMYLRAIFHRKFRKIVCRLSLIIPSGTTVLDIGGNHGRFAAELARAHNHGLTIHSFEPLPYNFATMELVTKKYRNVLIHPFGLSEHDEKMYIYTPVFKNGVIDHGSSFIAERLPKVKRQNWSSLVRTPIFVKEGDKVLDEIGVRLFSFAKIDVEGHELSVLRGLREHIERCYPLFFTEILPPHPNRANTTADLISWMRSLGYKPVLDDETSHRWSFIEWEDISNFTRHKGQDILLWHKNGPNGDRMMDLLKVS